MRALTWRGGCLVAALLATLAVAVPASPVAAHTELDFTLPADGTTVGEPVSEIAVGFTEAVTLIGNGFQVRDPNGVVLEPFPVTDDDRTFRLPLDPPLGGGSVGVRYEVAAADGHVLEGSFVFEVAAPAPTAAPPTTPAPTSTSAAPAAGPTVTMSSTAGPASAPATTTTIAVPVSTLAGGVPATTVAAAGEGDSNRGMIIAVAAVVAVVAAGFLLIRSRRRL